MNNNNNYIKNRSKLFAIKVIKTYTELNKKKFDDAGKILAEQFLRSGTSIGATLAEAEFAQSSVDYISMHSIALKKASETRYWINIMIGANVISHHNLSLMLDEINEIINILIATIKKLKIQEK